MRDLRRWSAGECRRSAATRRLYTRRRRRTSLFLAIHHEELIGHDPALEHRFIGDAFFAPQRVLGRHPANEHSQLSWNRRAPGPRLGAPVAGAETHSRPQVTGSGATTGLPPQGIRAQHDGKLGERDHALIMSWPRCSRTARSIPLRSSFCGAHRSCVSRLPTNMFAALRFRFELLQFGIQRVARRDNSDDLAVFDHRYVSEAILVHHEQRVSE